MKNNKRLQGFDLTSFLAGSLLSVIVTVAFFECVVIKNDTHVEDTVVQEMKEDESKADSEVTAYNTQIKQFEIKTASGETVYCSTPEGYFSLTDQYIDNLETYYNIDEIKSENMVVVGDSAEPYSSKSVIDANCLSDVKEMLAQVHKDDEGYDPDEVLESEAYTYMKTGKLPENIPDNYRIKEVDSFKQGDITFRVFKVEYDTDYEGETEEDKTTVHTEQLAAYSDTEDAVEVILIQESYDQKKGLRDIREFLNAEE